MSHEALFFIPDNDMSMISNGVFFICRGYMRIREAIANGSEQEIVVFFVLRCNFSYDHSPL